MFFSKTKLDTFKPNIYIKDKQIETVIEFKYLGVFWDLNLSYKKHIKKMSQTVRYNLFNWILFVFGRYSCMNSVFHTFHIVLHVGDQLIHQ